MLGGLLGLFGMSSDKPLRIYVVLCYQRYPTGPQTFVDSAWTEKKDADAEIEKHKYDSFPELAPANQYWIQEVRLNTSLGVQA